MPSSLVWLLQPPQGQVDWGLFRGACLAFLSQVSSIGKGLQRNGVQSLPQLSLRTTVLLQYAGNATWRAGVAIDVVGAMFGLAALTIVPVSVAQPIFSNGPMLLACWSQCFLGERLTAKDWRTIALSFTATLLLALSLVPRERSHWSRSPWAMQVNLARVLLLVPPTLLAAEYGVRRATTGVPNQSALELLTGLQAGVCIGVGNAALALGMQSMSRAWVANAAQAHMTSAHDMWPYVGMRESLQSHHLAAIAFTLTGAALNQAHLVFTTRGYRSGAHVARVSGQAALVSMATGILVGLCALGEEWPTRPLLSIARFIACVLIGHAMLTSRWDELKASSGHTGAVGYVQTGSSAAAAGAAAGPKGDEQGEAEGEPLMDQEGGRV